MSDQSLLPDSRGQASPFPVATLFVLVALTALALGIDHVLGTAQYVHTGPLGLTWVWSPGLTVVYLAALLWFVQFARGHEPGIIR